jgi:4-amino-4-deoxy-L-arabinose transferase-like glycosyltransferase
MKQPLARHRRALIAIIALGGTLRLGLFLWACHQSPDLSRSHLSDTVTYVKPAEALWNEGRFYKDSQPELFRTPGYPLLMIPGVALHQVALFTVCLQLILGVATIWLVHRMALDLFGTPAAALGAGLLMAIDPLSIIYSSILLSETLFTFVFVLFLRFLLRYFSSNATIDLVVCGLLLAAATFVRPVTYYLPLVLIVGLVARACWPTRRPFRLVQCGAFAIACWVPLGAWQVRNYQVANYSAFSASTDFNLYYHQAASAVARREGVTVLSVQDRFGRADGRAFDKVHPELRTASQAERYAFMGREGRRLLRQHLPESLKSQFSNALMISANPGATYLLNLAMRAPEPRSERPPGTGALGTARQMATETPVLFYTSLALSILIGMTYLLSMLGWLTSLKHRPLETMVLLGISAYLLAVSTGVIEARMRHPIMPIVCLLGGAGIAAVRPTRAWRPKSDNRSAGHQTAGNEPAAGENILPLPSRAA